MQRGIAAPILIILFGILAIVLVGLSGIPQKYFYNKSEEEVKGASVVQPVRSGFSVVVSSPGTWDLAEYLCSDDECFDSVDSGKRHATIGGGATEAHEVVVTYSDEWDQFTHIKLFAKPSLGSSDEAYPVVETTNLERVGGEIHSLEDSSAQILLVPIVRVKDIFVENVAAFSDN